MYHRVNTRHPDPWTTCVAPANFEEHLEVIRSMATPVSITFDDGYADNFQYARPLLEKYDLAATVFVTSGMVGSPHEMWWDELERKCLGNTPHGWDWDDDPPDAGASQYKEAFGRYRSKPFTIYQDRPLAREDRRLMSASEVATLAAGGLIGIGAHTVTHPVLSHLGIAQQQEEIVQSKRQLEDITGREVTWFAYPNGGKSDYTDDTVRIVREAGFARAYAAWEAPITSAADPYQMPRVMVRDWSGDVFASVLHRKLSE